MRGVAAERAAHANDQLGVASTGLLHLAACAAALCTVMRNPQRSRPCAAKSPSVTSCGSTKESALHKRLRSYSVHTSASCSSYRERDDTTK